MPVAVGCCSVAGAGAAAGLSYGSVAAAAVGARGLGYRGVGAAVSRSALLNAFAASAAPGVSGAPGAPVMAAALAAVSLGAAGAAGAAGVAGTAVGVAGTAAGVIGTERAAGCCCCFKNSSAGGIAGDCAPLATIAGGNNDAQARFIPSRIYLTSLWMEIGVASATKGAPIAQKLNFQKSPVAAPTHQIDASR